MVDDEDKLTTSQVKRLYSVLHQTNLDRDELSSLAQQDREKLASFLEPAFPWAFWYEIPYTHVLVLLLEAVGQLETFYDHTQTKRLSTPTDITGRDAESLAVLGGPSQTRTADQGIMRTESKILFLYLSM